MADASAAGVPDRPQGEASAPPGEPSEDPSSYQEAVRRDRALRRMQFEPTTTLRIVLGGNANLDFLVPALRVGLAAHGIGSEIRSTAFGNWIGETFDGDAPAADVWIVWMCSMGLSRGMTERPQHDIDAIAAATERLLARGTKVVLVHPDPLPVEDDPFSPFVAWRRSFVSSLRDALPPSVVQLEVEHLVRRIGIKAWSAPRYWEQAKAPCHPDAATAVASELAHVVARLLRPAVRAVVVDLDDTLWGGIIGEVGPEGLALDPDGTGRPYLELQRFLLDLRDRGIPLAVVSKNDDDVARRGFTERPEMLMTIDSFIRFDASWTPKYEAIASFAAQLNIGIDAVCFLDDSPKERDEARRMLPGLQVPDLPEAPGRRVAHLLATRRFMVPSVTDEDRGRVAFFERSSLPSSGDLDGYLAGLGMTLEASRIDEATFDRSVGLLHKTNQFNVTLWRPAPQELSTWLGPEHYAYAFRLTDRVVDAGVIAVLVVAVEDGVARIAGWVMSCRVFGRGVEWAVAQHLAEWLGERQIDRVLAPYAAGPRNALVRPVLEAIGLSETEPPATGSDSRDVTWFAADRLSPPAHHITIDPR